MRGRAPSRPRGARAGRDARRRRRSPPGLPARPFAVLLAAGALAALGMLAGLPGPGDRRRRADRPRGARCSRGPREWLCPALAPLLGLVGAAPAFLADRRPPRRSRRPGPRSPRLAWAWTGIAGALLGRELGVVDPTADAAGWASSGPVAIDPCSPRCHARGDRRRPDLGRRARCCSGDPARRRRAPPAAALGGLVWTAGRRRRARRRRAGRRARRRCSRPPSSLAVAWAIWDRAGRPTLGMAPPSRARRARRAAAPAASAPAGSRAEPPRAPRATRPPRPLAGRADPGHAGRERATCARRSTAPVHGPGCRSIPACTRAAGGRSRRRSGNASCHERSTQSRSEDRGARRGRVQPRLLAPRSSRSRSPASSRRRWTPTRPRRSRRSTRRTATRSGSRPRTTSGSRATTRSLSQELSAYLLEHARRQDYALLTRPEVLIEVDERLRLGEFGIQPRLVKPPVRKGDTGEQGQHGPHDGLLGRPPKAEEPRGSRRPAAPLTQTRAIVSLNDRRYVLDGPGRRRSAARASATASSRTRTSPAATPSCGATRPATGRSSTSARPTASRSTAAGSTPRGWRPATRSPSARSPSPSTSSSESRDAPPQIGDAACLSSPSSASSTSSCWWSPAARCATCAARGGQAFVRRRRGPGMHAVPGRPRRRDRRRARRRDRRRADPGRADRPLRRRHDRPRRRGRRADRGPLRLGHPLPGPQPRQRLLRRGPRLDQRHLPERRASCTARRR